MTREDDVRGLSVRLLADLVGNRIDRVWYRGLTSLDSVESADGLVFDSIGQGLLLSTRTGFVALDWSIDGYFEYLRVSGDPDSGPAAKVAGLVDVSRQRGWIDLAGSVVSRIGYESFESEDDSQMLWSIRIEVSLGYSVTIALGEFIDGRYEYQPDNLVAIFDSAVAKSVRIEGANGNAWGNDLSPMPRDRAHQRAHAEEDGHTGGSY